MGIYQLFHRIKRTGLCPGIPDDEVRRIRTVNGFSFITALLCTFCGVALSTISGDWRIFFTAMVFVAGFLSVLVFNRHHRFAAARVGLQSVFCAVMLYYGCLFGESAQVPFLGLFLIGVPLLVCSPEEQLLRFICLLMPLLALFLLETNYYYQVFTPMQLDRTGAWLFRWLIMTVVLLLNFMVISFYLANINSLVRQLRTKNDSLARRNEAVLRQEQELKHVTRLLAGYNEKLEEEVRQRTIELTNKSALQETILADLNMSLQRVKEKDDALLRYVQELETLKSGLLAARDEAERANAAKSAFLRELSHEIRNPLNAILGISYLLLHGREQRIPQDVLKYIENIHVSGQNLLGIINNVLELARIEAGKVHEVRHSPLVLREWIHSVAGVYHHAGQLKGASIHVQVDDRLPAQVMGDKVRLTQVVNNLLGNAVKFTPESGTVTLSCQRQGAGRWCIRVLDEGEGIPPDKQALIFKPFEQADASIHQRYGGTGLGLAISKRIVELMGGDISVWSEPGAGTCFTVSLPLHHVCTSTPTSVTTAAPLPPEIRTGATAKTILLMEDNRMNRFVIGEFIERMGLGLLTAENGEQGLDMAREHLPDVVMLDMHMPKMNGSQVLQALRQDPLLKDVPVIMISADAFREQSTRALSEGVDAYLAKPVQFEELKQTLEKFIHHRAPRGEMKVGAA